jgi:hypothetical protein
MSSGSRPVAAALAIGALLAGLLAGASIDSSEFSAGDLFNITKVWTVDFTFSPEQWKGIAPRYVGVGDGIASRLQGPEGRRNGLTAAGGVEFEWTHGNFSIDGRKFEDIAVRYKGNGTFRQAQSYGKISLKLDLNKYVKGQKLAKLDKLNLANNITDAGWMNEELAYRLFRDAGVPAPRTSYAKVYVKVGTGAREYWGLYSLVEDVDDDFAHDRFGAKGGLLLKPVTTNLFHYMGDDWAAYNQTYDPKDDMTPAQTKRVIEFCRFVTSADDAQFAAHLADYVDLEEFARFMAVTVWLTDMDSILDNGQNFYLYLNPETQKFSFIAWDQDHSFGQFGMRGSLSQRRNFSISHPWSANNPFLERVFGVPAFRGLYLAKMAEFEDTIFRPQRIFDQVNEIAPVIRPAIVEESPSSAQWFDIIVSDNGSESYGETVKGFVRARAQSVADQLDGKTQGTILDRGWRRF